MKSIVAGCLLAAVVAAAPARAALRGADATPATPVWPDAFSIPFAETTTSFGIFKYNTTGTFWYDSTNNRARTDRATGKHDRYCGTVKSDDSPCTHLVVDDKRWLYWPKLNYCCMCCTAAEGCGVVQPDWMVQANATYMGKAEVNGYTTNYWDAKGLQSNYYYATADATQAPVELNQDPDDVQYFDPAHYQVGPQDDSVFALPSYCSGNCPTLSICGLLNH